jgi:hypothetical protein
MMKSTFTILSAALIAAVTIQAAPASERRHVRKTHPAPAVQTYRDSNAWYAPAQPSVPDWQRYSNGAMSAPAGR